ncbi:MAG TPA: Gfo/Idh/MocA family oxidoreductase, partial [Candidatus Onthocola gallistercoris]|nr:Gfo/Idh/MocA family oxidoreductase [Candidatus Onthocola gallistercoris]
MINWGILGAGKIALRFAKSLESEPNSRLTAVSCRTQAKADAFAAEHGNCKAYAGHEKLLADPSIDAIYLALPHGLHHEWAIKALTSGKAVLCEKPAALSADQVKEMIHTASHSHRLFMEAMKPRFVPLYGHLKKLLSEGCIGELRS